MGVAVSSLAPLSIPAFLDGCCRQRGSAAAVWYHGAVWSYTELARLTDAAAAGFHRLGLRRGDRVALLLPNGPPALFAWFGLARLGAITAPLHPQASADEIARQIAFLDPAAALIDRRLAGRATALPRGLRLLTDADLAGCLDTCDALRGAAASPPPAPDDPADILLTSGTTGRPKGVIQSHRTYTLTGEAFAHWLRLTGEDRLFTCLPFSHINARAYSTMGALAAGACLILDDRFSASGFWDAVIRSGATQANAIGAMLAILMKAPPSPADRAHRLRLVYSAPALPEPDHEAFERRFGVRLVIGYGLSESTFGFIQPLDAPRRPGTMGQPRAHPDPRFGNEVRLENGEIWLRSAACFSGYFRDEAATRQALTSDGWLRTGDLATRDEEGWYTFAGRIKEIIRRRGENIAPAEVEEAITSHPAVAEAAVIGVPSPLGEQEVAAFVVAAPGRQAEVTGETMTAWCAARLSPFKVPSIWRFVASLPRTPTQRIARHLLKLD